jgi:Raf kinase inhibitor-like YbhB/YbcL family protein
MHQGLKLTALSLISAVLLVQPVAAQETHFSLSSSAFADNGIMALKYAGKNPANANCIGENVSPPLRWSNPPDGTRSYAIIMHDQEGRLGLGVTHWVAYGIPASTMALPEGAASDATAHRFINGKNTPGKSAYLGACPPKGSGPHHYVFTLIATGLEPQSMKPDLTMQQLLEEIGKNAKAATGLVGRFGH